MGYSIGQLSKMSGVKVPTIRYYEQIQLLEPSHRNAGNQRRYGGKGIERLSFIRHARDLGLSLEMIRELLALQGDPQQPCNRAHDIAKRHLTDIQQRIEKLKKLESELQRISLSSDDGCSSHCKVIQSLADHHHCSEEH